MSNITKLIIIFVISFILINVIFIYYHNTLLLYLIDFIINILFLYFILTIIKINNKYNSVLKKYNISLDCLSEYEELLNRYRVITHENKNQLQVIRNIGNYKLAKKYIDELIDNKNKDDKSVEKDLKQIPSSYLKAVFYSKINKMKNNNINYSIIVDRNINSKLLLNLDEKILLDICNVINIILDNAIDSSIESNKKIVLISICKSDKISITISNTYNNDIDIVKIYENGYTTKEKGHGYGLSLLKEIINKNKYLSNETELDDTYFTQIVNIST